MPKDTLKWRNLEEERQKAMRKLELREAREESYANKFSSKTFPRNLTKKEREMLKLVRKAFILAEEIKARKGKGNV